MADTSNLTNFLQDVADAIKTKKEYPSSQKIAAEDFDTEIASIDTGIDTSDATATADDVINPKTFYSHGQKLTGNMQATYVPLKDVIVKPLSFNNAKYIQDINWEYKLCIIANYNDTAISIYKINDDYTLGNLVSTKNITSSYKSLRSARFSKSLYGNNLLVWVGAVSSGNWSVLCYECTTNGELSDPKVNNYYTSWMSTNQCVLEVNPATPTQAVLGYCSGSTSDSRICQYTYDGTTISRAENGRVYAYGATSVEFSYTGDYCIIYSGNYAKPSGYVLKQGNTVRKSGALNMPTTMYKNQYAFCSNKYYDMSSFTLIHTYDSDDYTPLSQDGIMWYSDGLLFKTYNNKLYIYRVTTSSEYPLLELVKTVDVVLSLNGSYKGSPYYPIANSPTTLLNSITSGFYFNDKSFSELNTLTTSNGITLYNTMDTDITASDILSSKVGYGSSGKVTGTMPNNGALTYTPSTSQQTIPAGYTSGGTIAAVTNTIDENIQAENIKEGVEILGITGTFEGGGSGDVKLFNTVEEMQADTTAQEGDLAIVYRFTLTSPKPGDIISNMTFPNTVVFDTPISSSKNGMLAGSSMYLALMLNASSFNVMDYMSMNNMASYTSSDGITYTRTDGGSTSYDVGQLAIGNDIDTDLLEFIKVSGYAFEGLYIYDGTNYTLAPTQIDAIGDQVYKGTFYGKNGVETGTLQNNINVTSTELFNKVNVYNDLRNLKLADFNTPLNIFNSNTNIRYIPSLDFGNSLNTSGMFYNCKNLIEIGTFNIGNVINTVNMFYNCVNLIDIGTLNMNSVVQAENMFYGCNNLSTNSYITITNMLPNANQLDKPLIGYMGLNVANFTNEQLNILSIKGYLDTELSNPNWSNTYNVYYE